MSAHLVTYLKNFSSCIGINMLLQVSTNFSYFILKITQAYFLKF